MNETPPLGGELPPPDKSDQGTAQRIACEVPMRWTDAIFQSLEEALAAGVSCIAEIHTGMADRGDHATGVRFVELAALKFSQHKDIASLRENVIANRKGDDGPRSKIIDHKCGKEVLAFKRKCKDSLAARTGDGHECGVVGLGSHSKQADYSGSVDGEEESARRQEVTDLDPVSVEGQEIAPEPSRGHYVPAFRESVGHVEYSVDVRLGLDAPKFVPCSEQVIRPERRPCITQHYMPAERLIIHLLKRSALLRLLPSERRTNQEVMGRLQRCLDLSSINEVPASAFAFIACDGDDRGRWDRYVSVVRKNAASGKAAGLVIGELTLPLVGSPDAPNMLHYLGLPTAIRTDDDPDSDAMRRLAGRLRATKRSQFGKVRVLGVGLLTFDAAGSPLVARVGSLLLSGEYVFAESLGEARESNSMAAAQVDHEKCIDPLEIYSSYIPDYLIHGFEFLVVVERWGLTTDDYRAQMANKQSAARGKLPLVESDAALDPGGLPIYPQAIHAAIQHHREILSGLLAGTEADPKAEASVGSPSALQSTAHFETNGYQAVTASVQAESPTVMNDGASGTAPLKPRCGPSEMSEWHEESNALSRWAARVIHFIVGVALGRR